MSKRLPRDTHPHPADQYLQAHQRGLVRDALAADAAGDRSSAGNDRLRRALDIARLRYEVSCGPNPYMRLR